MGWSYFAFIVLQVTAWQFIFIQKYAKHMCRYDNIEIEMIIDVVFSDKWKIFI